MFIEKASYVVVVYAIENLEYISCQKYSNENI